MPLSRLKPWLDAILIAGCYLLWGRIYSGEISEYYIRASVFSAICFNVGASITGLYASQFGEARSYLFGRLLSTWLLMVSCLLLVAYISKYSALFSRVIFLLWVFTTPLLQMLVWRGVDYLSEQVGRQGKKRRIALIGPVDVVDDFLERTGWHRTMDAAFYAFSDDEVSAFSSLRHVQACVGNRVGLVADARQGMFEEVYVLLPLRDELRLRELLADLSDCAVIVRYVPDLFSLSMLHSRIHHIGDVAVVGIFDSPLDEYAARLKRVEDVVLSLLFITITAIPMLLIAIGVKCTSPGPVLFKQRRYGLGGQEIQVWKFRSMTVTEDGGSIVQATRGDARVTPFGAFLRRTSLDELPQFFNVLGGAMSIVGPRPHAVAHNELYRQYIDGYMLRHIVKPGITGWAQVNGARGETDTLEKMQRRVKYDMEYIKNWSIFFDAHIILLTVIKGFVNRNAY